MANQLINMHPALYDNAITSSPGYWIAKQWKLRWLSVDLKYDSMVFGHDQATIAAKSVHAQRFPSSLRQICRPLLLLWPAGHCGLSSGWSAGLPARCHTLHDSLFYRSCREDTHPWARCSFSQRWFWPCISPLRDFPSVVRYRTAGIEGKRCLV